MRNLPRWPALALALFACDRSDSQRLDPPAPTPELIAKEVGGEVAVGDEFPALRGARVVIPAGALEADTRISIALGEAIADDDDTVAEGPVALLGPAGTRFSSPVKITLPHSADALDEDLLRVYVVGADGAGEVLLPDAIEIGDGVVSFELEHFTRVQVRHARHPCRHLSCPTGSCRRGRCVPPAGCGPSECGPAPGLPNHTCADGSVAGPTGRCLRQASGRCGWEVLTCPDPCAAILCAPNTTCDPGTGRCAPAAGGACGPNTCAANEFCCNASCGICAPRGGACTQQACTSCANVRCAAGTTCDPATGQCHPNPCATVRCASGTTCNPTNGQCEPDRCATVRCASGTICNPANGQCEPTGCTHTGCARGETCDASTGRCQPAACRSDSDCSAAHRCIGGQCRTDPCATVRCASGTRCDPSNGQCVANCAGVSCPSGQRCDPATGHCVGTTNPCAAVTCPTGQRCDPATGLCHDPCATIRCANGTVCNPATATCDPVPTACGSATCPAGQVCCNASCGICTPPGGACTQQACGPSCGPNQPCPSGSVCDASGHCVVAMNQWYRSCGDPVCRGHTPSAGVPACTHQTVGDPCRTPGASCDPMDPCNVRLVCTDTDPTAAGCPRSQRAVKQDIEYATADQLRALHQAVLGIPLATYHYKDDPNAPARLGFIIEDVGQSPAVLPNGQQVDVYGYASMAVAALKVQAEQIRALEAHIAKLEARLGEVEAKRPKTSRAK